MIEPIIGNRKLLEAFLSAICTNRVAGCYIIEGAAGTGKRTVARYIAAALCCPHRKADGTPCLSCHSCRSIENNGHIDVFTLLPTEDKKNVTIENTRQMLQNLYIHPAESDWRIFIIPDSHRLSEKIQNALLKSIEEPPENTVFFLLTEDRSRLLPTVRSRAVHFRTEPLSAEEIRSALQNSGLPAEQLEDAVLFSAGSLGQAKVIAKDSAFHQLRTKVLDYFKAVSEGAGFTRLCLFFPPASTTRSDLEKIFPIMKLAFRDLLYFRFGGDGTPSFFPRGELLKDLTSIIPPEKALKLFQLSDELTVRVSQNANVFSALTEFHLAVKKLTRNR